MVLTNLGVAGGNKMAKAEGLELHKRKEKAKFLKRWNVVQRYWHND